MSASGRAVRAACLVAALSGCSPERLQAVELAPNTLSNALSSELLAHWAFDEPSGSVAHDDSGNARNGQLTGGSWRADGQFAGALHLDDGQLVSVPRFPDATSSFTVSAWVRLAQYSQETGNEGQWTTVVSTETSGGWEINVDHVNPDPGLHFGFWKGPNQGDYEGHSCAGLELNVWTQVAGVVDASASTFTVYRDGAACFFSATKHKILPGSATLTIGSWPFIGRYLTGDVDDIAIWGRALVPAEIESLFQAPVPPPADQSDQ